MSASKIYRNENWTLIYLLYVNKIIMGCNDYETYIVVPLHKIINNNFYALIQGNQFITSIEPIAHKDSFKVLVVIKKTKAMLKLGNNEIITLKKIK